jgi:hypothetical protein
MFTMFVHQLKEQRKQKIQILYTERHYYPGIIKYFRQHLTKETRLLRTIERQNKQTEKHNR